MKPPSRGDAEGGSESLARRMRSLGASSLSARAALHAALRWARSAQNSPSHCLQQPASGERDPVVVQFPSAAPPQATREQGPVREQIDLVQALAHADAALDQFAHDGRVTLTVIKGRAQLLQRQAYATGLPDPRLLRGLDEIVRAIDRLDHLLEERLLAASPVKDSGDGVEDR